MTTTLWFFTCVMCGGLGAALVWVLCLVKIDGLMGETDRLERQLGRYIAKHDSILKLSQDIKLPTRTNGRITGSKSLFKILVEKGLA